MTTFFTVGQYNREDYDEEATLCSTWNVAFATLEGAQDAVRAQIAANNKDNEFDNMPPADEDDIEFLSDFFPALDDGRWMAASDFGEAPDPFSNTGCVTYYVVTKVEVR